MVNFTIDFNGYFEDENVSKCLSKVEKLCVKDGIKKLTAQEVPWFPTKIEHLNFLGEKFITVGHGIEDVDHPTFRDPDYVRRRLFIAEAAMGYRVGTPIPRIDYTVNETKTWGICYEALTKSYKTRASHIYNDILAEFEKEIGYSPAVIPQLEDISQFLKKKSGWMLKPVGGLISQREFLNGLAFKVFHSTQYIRHHAKPLYTPEPDIMHELMGHAPMFSHKPFADFSQDIGLASLGASELELRKLAAIYWFTIEFGMVKEATGVKAYGAGILGGVGELEYCMTEKPKLYPLDLDDITTKHYDNIVVNDMQPYYFVAESF